MIKIAKFASITSFSGIMQVISIQGLVFILNIFFGVAINAVYSIANQVKQSLISFSYNIYKAISPQITKTFANKEYNHYKQLVYTGSKAEAFMNFYIMIPLLFKTKYILSLWLGDVPNYLVDFTQVILFSNLAYAVIAPFYDAVYATNQITRFQILPEIIYLLVLPISYFLNTKFNNPVLMMAIIVVFDIVICSIRMWVACRVTILSEIDTLKKVVFPLIVVGGISCVFCYMLSPVLQMDTVISLITLLLFNGVFLTAIIYFVGLNNQEKSIIKQIAFKMYGKIIHL